MELGSSNVFEVTSQNIQKDVAERSRTMPVLLLFWAAQVLPSVAAKKSLESMMPAYNGKAALALVDVARDQSLAQQLRVQSLPAIRVLQNGQVAEQLDGPQSDRVYRQLLDQLTMSSGDMLRASLAEVLAARDFATALAILQESIQQEPNNPVFRVELADVLIRGGQLDEARKALATVPDDASDRKRPVVRLELWEEVAGMDTLDQLLAAVGNNPADLDAKYALCVRQAVLEEYETALELALDVLRTDRKFRDDIGRLTMIRIFDLLGKGSPLAASYRRRMFNFLH